MTPEIPYKRNVVEPIACIKAGWELVKPQYWLIVGMCFVGMLIASAASIILLGPMMCGLYLTLLAQRRREPIEFGMLFKGFEYFAPSLVASLIHMIPIMVIIIPTYFLFYASLFVTMAAQGDDPNPAALLAVMGTFGLVLIVIMVIILVISVGFTFTFPLIVDRKLGGIDAVRVSFKAAMTNFWRLLGMMLLTSILSVVGMALCYVGAFLVIPISYGAIAAAYEQVFGLSRPGEFQTNLPPPPPIFE